MRFPLSEIMSKAEYSEEIADNLLLGNETTSTEKHIHLYEGVRNHSSFDNVVDDLINTLKHLPKFSCSADVHCVLDKVDNVVEFLPGPLTVQKLLKVDVISDQLRVFAENMYGLSVKTVANKFDYSFPFSENGDIYKPIAKLYVVDNHLFFCESCDILANELSNSKNVEAVVLLLTKLLMSEGLFALLVHETLEEDTSNVLANEMHSRYESNIQNIISLPNKVANTLKGNFPNFFKLNNYCNILLLNAIKVLEFFSDAIASNQVSFDVLNFHSASLFLSKVVVHFYEVCRSESFEKFVKLITYRCTKVGPKQYSYKRILTEVLTKLQKPAIERLATLILQSVNSEDYKITDILTHNLFTNKNWHFVLYTKLPLISFFKENDINLINNLIIYISQTSQKDLLQLLLNLIDVWSDKFAINHTSIEHHLYVTKLFIVAMKYLNFDEFTPTHVEIVREKVFVGIPAHLESGLDQMRVIGMVTGEIVSSFFSYSEDLQLKFEYEKYSKELQDLANSLKMFTANEKKTKTHDNTSINFEQVVEELTFGLEIRQSIPYLPPKRQFRNKLDVGDLKSEFMIKSCKVERDKLTIIDDIDFQLDSDDDLEPYNISNDVRVLKIQPPSYLRDLRDGLLETKNPDIFISSLEICEKLIIQELNKDDATIGLELLEILITLTPTFYVEHFDTIVFQSCIAITCTYPVVFAEYLCRQFHADSGTYSICHRMLMLDVLSESAKVLSHIQQNKYRQTQEQVNPTIQKAEQIIKEHLENKTKRFIKHKHRPFEQVNKFSDVAGSFFFPLIYSFGKSTFLPYTIPNDNDCLLLINYLQTLSVIMCCTQNCPIASKMSKELFSISWFLRFHKDPKVRIATLTLLAAAIFCVPKSVLMNDFADILLEIRLWLQDILDLHTKSEQNVECRMLANQLMCLVEDVLKIDMKLEL